MSAVNLRTVKLLGKAEKCFLRGKYQKARGLLDEALGLESRNLEALVLRLEVAVAEGAHQQICDLATEVLRASRNHNERAKGLLRRAVQRQPNSPLGLLHWELDLAAGDVASAWQGLQLSVAQIAARANFVQSRLQKDVEATPTALGKKLLFGGYVQSVWGESQLLGQALKKCAAVHPGATVLVGAVKKLAVELPELPAPLLPEFLTLLERLGEFLTVEDVIERHAKSDTCPDRVLLATLESLGAETRMRPLLATRYASLVAAGGGAGRARNLIETVVHGEPGAAESVLGVLQAQTPAVGSFLTGCALHAMGRTEPAVDSLVRTIEFGEAFRSPSLDLLVGMFLERPDRLSLARAFTACSLSGHTEEVRNRLRRVTPELLDRDPEGLGDPSVVFESMTLLRKLDTEDEATLSLCVRAAIRAGLLEDAEAVLREALREPGNGKCALAIHARELVAAAPDRVSSRLLLLETQVAAGDTEAVAAELRRCFSGGESERLIAGRLVLDLLDGESGDGLVSAVESVLLSLREESARMSELLLEAVADPDRLSRLQLFLARHSELAFELGDAIRGVSAFCLGNRDEARQFLMEQVASEAEAIEPIGRVLDSLPESIQPRVEVELLHSELLVGVGRHDQAVAKLRPIVEAQQEQAVRAIAVLDRLLASRSDHARALLCRGIARLADSKPAAAIKDLEHACRLDTSLDSEVVHWLERIVSCHPENPEGFAASGRVHLQQGRAARAVEVLRDELARHPKLSERIAHQLATVAEAAPEEPTARFWLGVAWSRSGADEKAAQAFLAALDLDRSVSTDVEAELRRFLRTDGGSRPVRFLLVDLLIRLRRYEDALNEIVEHRAACPEDLRELLPVTDRLIDAATDFLEARYERADLLADLRDSEGAVKTLEELLEIRVSERERVIETLRELTTGDANAPCVHYALSTALEEGRREPEAASALLRIVEPFPDELPAILGRLAGLSGRVPRDRGVLIELYRAHLLAGDPEPAAQAVARIYALDSQAFRPEVVELYETILHEHPLHVPSRLALGEVLVDGRRQEEAVGAFVTAIQTNRGCLDDAIRGLTRARDLDTHDARSHFELGEAYSLRPDFAATVQHHRAAVERDATYVDRVITSEEASLKAHPGVGELHLSLGRFYAEFRQNHKRAIEYYSAGLDLTKNREIRTGLYRHRGMSRRACREDQLAYEDFKAATDLMPVERSLYDFIREHHGRLLEESADRVEEDAADQEALLGKAANLLHRGHVDRALSVLQEHFTRETPLFAEAEFLKGLGFRRIRRNDLARAAFANCRDGVPESSELGKACRYQLAECLIEAGAYDDAVESLEQVYEMDVAYPNLRARLDDVMIRLVGIKDPPHPVLRLGAEDLG